MTYKTDKEFHDRLRAKVREREGRYAEPSAGVIDPQSRKPRQATAVAACRCEPETGQHPHQG